MPVTFYSIQLLNYFVSPVWGVTFVVLLQHGVTLSQLLFSLTGTNSLCCNILSKKSIAIFCSIVVSSFLLVLFCSFFVISNLYTGI